MTPLDNCNMITEMRLFVIYQVSNIHLVWDMYYVDCIQLPRLNHVKRKWKLR